MGADEAGLTRSQRMRLDELAARLVLGYGFYPEDAVRTAAELVAEGVDVDGLVQLASQPADVNAIDSQEVEILFRGALAEVGLQPPSRETRRVDIGAADRDRARRRRDPARHRRSSAVEPVA